MSVLDVALPERKEILKKLCTDVFNGMVHQTETTVSAGTTYKTYLNVFSPAKNKQGDIVAIFLTSRDITAKKNSTENYKTLFNVNPLPMFTLDVETLKFLELNLASIKHYGYTVQEVLAMQPEQLMPGTLLQHIKDLASNGLSQKDFFYKQQQHKTKQGKLIYVNITGHVFLQNGRQTALLIAEDVTEVVVAELKLQESEKQYRLLFNNNPLPAWIYDISTLKFLEVNEAAIQHYGYSRQQFLQMTVNQVHPAEQLELFYKAAEENKHADKFFLSNWKHQKKDGQIINVDIYGSIQPYEGKKAGLMMMNDTTARLLAETNLKLSNERFQLAAKAAAEALWEWDVEQDQLYISPVYKEMFGYEVEHTKKFKELHQHIHPEDYEEVTKSFHTIIDNKQKNRWEKEYRYQKADGTYMYIADHCIIIRNKEGKATKVVGAMQNISKRKEAEKEISKSNERFKLAGKATYDAIYDWDLVTNELTWGEGLRQLFGYRQLTIKQWNENIHPDEAENIKEHIYKTIHQTKKKRWFATYRFKRSDNNYSYVRDRSFIVRDKEGKPLRMIGAMQDITDIKINEEKLIKSNERFDAVMKATHDLIWDWDLQTGTFYRDERGLKKVYGLANGKTIQNIHDWLKRVHPDDTGKVQIMINNIIQASVTDVFDVEYRFKRDDGTYSNVYDRGIIIRNSEGKPIRMLGAAQDITDRKKLEQQLLLKELEKQRIISKASIDSQEKERQEIGKELHDNVNQVLTTTKLYLELSLSSPDIKDDLIAKSAANVIYVINEIRQLSRSLMNPSLGDLGLIDSVKDLVENVHLTGKVKVSFKAAKEVDTLLNENLKLTVFRIVQEALNNIIKHASATKALISINKKENNVQLTVKDNGKGFNIDSSKKGSGLKSIQNRVYLTNGNLKIMTEPGKGCTLFITLPYLNTNNPQ